MQWFKGIFFAGLSRHQASITGSAAHRRRTAAAREGYNESPKWTEEEREREENRRAMAQVWSGMDR